MRKLIQYWLPPLLWAALILLASTDAFSSGHTDPLMDRIVARLFGPGALTPKQLEWLHFFIRKGAHLTEYGIFGALAFRGARGPRPGWIRHAAVVAVVCAAALAAVDESLQSLTPSRMGSPVDTLIDTAGATLAQILIWLRLRPRTASELLES